MFHIGYDNIVAIARINGAEQATDRLAAQLAKMRRKEIVNGLAHRLHASVDRVGRLESTESRSKCRIQISLNNRTAIEPVECACLVILARDCLTRYACLVKDLNIGLGACAANMSGRISRGHQCCAKTCAVRIQKFDDSLLIRNTGVVNATVGGEGHIWKEIRGKKGARRKA